MSHPKSGTALCSFLDSFFLIYPYCCAFVISLFCILFCLFKHGVDITYLRTLQCHITNFKEPPAWPWLLNCYVNYKVTLFLPLAPPTFHILLAATPCQPLHTYYSYLGILTRRSGISANLQGLIRLSIGSNNPQRQLWSKPGLSLQAHGGHSPHAPGRKSPSCLTEHKGRNHLKEYI